MKKKDFITALIIGEISAWLIILISKNFIENFPLWWLLPIILPILCGGGMMIALFFEKRSIAFYQLSKFFLVGGMNVLVDLGILNLLIFASGIAAGLWYSIFKGISFLVATTNSYLWNKYWTFQTPRGKFNQFLVISAIGFLINVGTASLIVNVIGPSSLQSMPNIKAYYDKELWANIGAIIGSIAGLIWNFIGYKFVVFK